jgi:hypothetical protein
MRILAAFALLALLGTSAFAGEDGSSGLCGFDCENMCPLAHQANERRAVGTEALAIGSKVHADLAVAVVKNLAKI